MRKSILSLPLALIIGCGDPKDPDKSIQQETFDDIGTTSGVFRYEQYRSVHFLKFDGKKNVEGWMVRNEEPEAIHYRGYLTIEGDYLLFNIVSSTCPSSPEIIIQNMPAINKNRKSESVSEEKLSVSNDNDVLDALSSKVIGCLDDRSWKEFNMAEHKTWTHEEMLIFEELLPDYPHIDSYKEKNPRQLRCMSLATATTFEYQDAVRIIQEDKDGPASFTYSQSSIANWVAACTNDRGVEVQAVCQCVIKSAQHYFTEATFQDYMRQAEQEGTPPAPIRQITFSCNQNPNSIPGSCPSC